MANANICLLVNKLTRKGEPNPMKPEKLQEMQKKMKIASLPSPPTLDKLPPLVIMSDVCYLLKTLGVPVSNTTLIKWIDGGKYGGQKLGGRYFMPREEVIRLCQIKIYGEEVKNDDSK